VNGLAKCVNLRSS